jgi:hypothetical protein
MYFITYRIQNYILLYKNPNELIIKKTVALFCIQKIIVYPSISAHFKCSCAFLTKTLAIKKLIDLIQPGIHVRHCMPDEFLVIRVCNLMFFPFTHCSKSNKSTYFFI